MATVIEARNIKKRYGYKYAVDGLNFEVKAGECFGLIGPNGAGKTSTLQMTYCSSELTEGDLFILGLSVKDNKRKIKSQIGVVPQENGLDIDFSVLDNLMVFSSYYGVPYKEALTRSRELLRFMHLEDYEEHSCDQLSGGMQRRLAIARALISQPEIIVLDEPTTGLDPQARYWIWESLNNLKKEGKTLVLTTHYMDEAQRLCDRIALMDKGKILSIGAPNELISEYIGKEVVEFSQKSDDLDYYIKRIKEKDFEYQVLNNKVRIFIREKQSSAEALKLVSSENIVIRKASLDDVFLKLAGYGISEK